MAKTSPTSRSLQLLKKEGYIAQVVEKFISFINKRIDYLNIIDILAFKPEEKGLIGVQSTTDTGGQMSKHYKKALGSEYLKPWLENGNRFVIHAWDKKGPAGKRKLWQVREKEITLKDLKEADNNG